MARIIRRTLTITIHEQWTFVWTPEQTSESQVVEDAPLPSPAELAQQLAKLLGLSMQATTQPGSLIQIFVPSQAKEYTDDNTNS